MTILGIETSCDETAVSVVVGAGGLREPKFKVLAHVVSSQIKLHAQWGGVVPTLAKREHSKNLIPVLKKALGNAKLIRVKDSASSVRCLRIESWKAKVEKILAREPELLEQFLKFIPTVAVPKIDVLAVTSGPGLEPALWVGINLARALSIVWRKPIIPINHLEGHIYSVLVLSINHKPRVKKPLRFPALALLISGGHTELTLVRDWLKYATIGATRDDAAGEAFDKAARLLGLPYPGGPALAKLAKNYKLKAEDYSLPRPMIGSPDFDFSFSGLKTAVLYRVNNLKKTGCFDDAARAALAADFQQAVIDVLLSKTSRAIMKYKPKTLIVAGGVSANKSLRRQFAKCLAERHPAVRLLFPEPKLSLDNATMIAAAGYLRFKRSSTLTNVQPLIKADGNLILS